jgi:rare lipoprotein A (peptidoglycan hydrolase)
MSGLVEAAHAAADAGVETSAGTNLRDSAASHEDAIAGFQPRLRSLPRDRIRWLQRVDRTQRSPQNGAASWYSSKFTPQTTAEDASWRITPLSTSIS